MFSGLTQSKIISASILCKFWQENGVWNATAEDLPIAVFGDTFEEAKENMSNALLSHLDSVSRAGKAEEFFEYLHEKSRAYLSVDEISPDSPLVKMLVALKDKEVFPLST